MPYRDLERRRQYQRQYKYNMRKKQGKLSPLKAFKIYLCMRYPTLHLAGTSFYNSFLITDNPEIQAQVEQSDLFGRDIFALALDLDVNLSSSKK